MRATRWVLLVTVVGLMCLSVPAMASDSRVDALTVNQKYLEDYVNFRTFPTVAARYANLVTASLGTASPGDDKSVGVIGAGDNTSYGVFAVYLNQVQRQVNDPIAGAGPWEQAQLDVTWAKQFTSLALGVGLLYTTSSAEQMSESNSPIGGGINNLDNPNANQFALTGGIKLDMSSSAMLELAAQAGWWGWEEKDATGAITSEDDGKLSFGVAGRIMAEVNSQTTLVPVLCYSKMDLTEKPAPSATDFEVSRSMLNLGVALQREVNGNDLLVLGVSADYMKDTLGPDNESTWMLPNLFIALEFDVYSWLTVRTGASKSFDRFDADTPDVQVKHSDYRFGLGMGLHFDHFDVDATVEPNAVFTGGYLFSGDSTTNPLAKVTATYYY